MSVEHPIAILAQGAGGLGVADHLQRRLPHEDVVVLVDGAYSPYARRPPAVVADRVLRLAEGLIGEGAKLLVLASAIATEETLAAVQARLAVPVVGFEATLAEAGARVRGGTLAVVAAEGCLRGQPHAGALRRVRGPARVVSVAWPVVELVDGGEATSESTRRLVAAQVASLQAAGVDAIALACAHTAVLAPLVRELAVAPELPVFDAASIAASRAHLTLARAGLLVRRRRPGRRIVQASQPAVGSAAMVGGLKRPAWVR